MKLRTSFTINASHVALTAIRMNMAKLNTITYLTKSCVPSTAEDATTRITRKMWRYLKNWIQNYMMIWCTSYMLRALIAGRNSSAPSTTNRSLKRICRISRRFPSLLMIWISNRSYSTNVSTVIRQPAPIAIKCITMIHLVENTKSYVKNGKNGSDLVDLIMHIYWWTTSNEKSILLRKRKSLRERNNLLSKIINKPLRMKSI